MSRVLEVSAPSTSAFAFFHNSLWALALETSLLLDSLINEAMLGGMEWLFLLLLVGSFFPMVSFPRGIFSSIVVETC